MQQTTHTYLCLIGAPLLMMMASCNGSHAEEETKEVQTAVQVKTLVLQKSRLENSLKLPGEIKPFQFADLYAKVNSYVKEVQVDLGSQVSKGQILATLEAPEMNSQLLGARSRLHTREAVFRASKANYERLLRTSKVPGTISPNDLDLALSKMSADSAELLAARSAYQEVQRMLDYLVIRAPFSGVISQRNAHPGTYVGPGARSAELPMFRLEEQSKLRLAVAVPEVYTGGLQQAGEVRFTVRSLPGDTFRARVARVAGSLDTRLRTETLEMDISNKDKQLLPGMYAEALLPLPGKQDVYVVPKSVIVSNSEKVFVIRIVNNQSRWVPVTRGNEYNGMVEIFGGLNDQDVLVKNASDEIKEGTPLQAVKE
ncbi:efflux RND transporter periplasmic adaptor subunit [uncultured Chitinophaga sp.]|jgi:RND family efflux transporter, MFP subunit|uniref:efflux RND transporter periplasmic adaptor subunit n=1 Tax=uncultured Chitinophaga sp. TaxID=339340 RepID=UPI002629511E|nr:efflux RND transporter periplasmic adaptor subunit [uncultured Chitinophaga sp.]